MCVNEVEARGTVRLQGLDVEKVQEFKYLWSTVQSNVDSLSKNGSLYGLFVIYKRQGSTSANVLNKLKEFGIGTWYPQIRKWNISRISVLL
uniref:Uncharacterized protein n=1 Tax=Mola mola TaxID=94237 RepID=A0A3Q3VK19_MOLML